MIKGKILNFSIFFNDYYFLILNPKTDLYDLLFLYEKKEKINEL